MLPLKDTEVSELVHSPKKGRRSALEIYLEQHLKANVDVEVGAGFLNYINGYVTKAQRQRMFSTDVGRARQISTLAQDEEALTSDHRSSRSDLGRTLRRAEGRRALEQCRGPSDQ